MSELNPTVRAVLQRELEQVERNCEYLLSKVTAERNKVASFERTLEIVRQELREEEVKAAHLRAALGIGPAPPAS
jgi:hypothetical protein